MFLPKSIKIIVVFAVMFSQACNYWQSSDSRNANAFSVPFATQELKTNIPFSSKEPDVYQTEIVLTTYTGAGKSERRSFTARNGAKFRSDYENKISFLQPNENERFLIHSGKKIYAESRTNADAASESDQIKDFLITEWLNEKRGATFENLGAENGLTKYLVRLENAANTTSEMLIFVDENLKFPVKQEFYTRNGEQKNLVFSMELQNVKLQTDDKLFELPRDYRKVSSGEFQKAIRHEQVKNND